MSFGTVFAQATELEWLDLGRGSVLDEDDRISDAVAAMTKLRVLLIQSPTPTTLKTLKDMQAPLTAVDADFFGYNGRCRDPVVVFSPFKESLETMKVASVHFSKPDVRYHRVTSLTAQDCHNVHLLNMVRCFPNLQDLHLEVGQGAVSSEWFIDSQRSQNLEARAQVVWQSLTRLSGNLVCLYTLALCHSVDHLCVASSMLTPADEERLSAVLRDLRGLHSLYLKLKAPDFDTATLDRALAPVKATLAELMLRLEYRGRNYREVPAYTNAMIESLSAFPLHTLRLCIKWYYNGPKGDPMFDSNFNHLSIAEHAMRCIASLRYIYVEIEPTATEFDIESKVEGDGRLVRFLQPLEEQWSLADPDALFSNDFLESWWQVTGS
ncbi:uncharacterized protein PHACADRAFT_254338 [Phanerochaete carnosa HHB-10118-sp]|uniref:Uncharacterized protein n=1 Tax=Phanerochaete carnosa (strain HHB-10118-sp) TaxID=650164 RepID=K5X2D1_PHACS|nr:uncharacterized protein PHACADRAFT_254338 [Phanerochaete carnosa HHB-10118-sp]EKM56937.1 hypothetical protein PHACADRAFT_254338 [Phanerochaete carnosa HHB-10118-sp]